MEFSGWQKNRLGQPSIAHDSQRLVMLAAVGQAPLARIASLAVEVRFDRAPVTDGMVRYTFPQGEDFYPQFMARNSGVTEERHLPEIASDVGAANPHAVHPHQCLTGAWWAWRGNIDVTERSGAFQLQRLHGFRVSYFKGNQGDCQLPDPHRDVAKWWFRLGRVGPIGLADRWGLPSRQPASASAVPPGKAR